MDKKILDFNKENGLVYCQNLTEAKNNAELLYILEAQKIGVDAVFFRRFYSNNSLIPYYSEPAVCILKKTDNFFNSFEHIKLHAALWSAGKNEIYIILGETKLFIINARKPAKVIDNTRLSLEYLLLASSSTIEEFNDKRFSAHLFGSGTFWEQKDFYDGSKNSSFFNNKLEEENMPYHQLLTFLKNTRDYLRKKNSLLIDYDIIDKLLIICILIKFLEEIKSENGSHSLTQIYKKYKVVNFAEALMIKGKSIEILEELGEKLNGRIFDYFTEKSNAETEEEFLQRNSIVKNKLRESDLSPISNLLLVRVNKRTGELEFDIFNSQLKLDFDFSWEQYSFRYLPIELISSIYEHFLQEDAREKKGMREKGVVYTPPLLVNFLIDEVMPLESPHLFKNNIFKVLDPSCGSGVFLVAAYKRLLQWWLINNINENNKLPDRFNPKVFQNILENNIYGVDVNKKASLISVFSLTIAFLDKLDPIALWQNLNFKKLQDNIKSDNFFNWIKYAEKDFDLVIGNPPFNVENDKTKSQVLISKNLSSLNLIPSKIPNKNFALHFLEVSIALSKKVCMIIPANALLYNKAAQNYRQFFFTNYTVNKIFDFTHLRRGLFHKAADIPVVAVIVENKESTGQPIEHIVIKRIISTEKKIRFEIDYYDRHLVNWTWATDKNKYFVWKSNLLGGGRLFHLINKFHQLPTLEDYIKSKNSWKKVRGFEGGTETLLQNVDKIINIKDDGQPEVLYNTSITTNKLKNVEMYQPPFLVAEQVLGKKSIPVSFVPVANSYSNKTKLYYNRDFIGIKVPEQDEQLLRKIYENFLFHEELDIINYQLYALIISSNCMILHETAIRQGDILSLPYDEDTNLLTLSEDEAIVQDDVLNYNIHLGKSISDRGTGKILQSKVTLKHLKEYGKVFCKVLNSLYEKDNFSWQQGQIYQTNLFTICQFGYGRTNDLNIEYFEDINDDFLHSLVEDKLSNSSALFSRIVKVFKSDNDFDCIFFIKPHFKRYWLRSIALRDADDTFYELRKAGY